MSPYSCHESSFKTSRSYRSLLSFIMICARPDGQLQSSASKSGFSWRDRGVLHCVSHYLPMTLKLRLRMHSCSCTMAWWWPITEDETSCQVINIRKRFVCGWKHCYIFKTTQHIQLNVGVTTTGSGRDTFQEIARIPDENHEELKCSPTHCREATFYIIDHNTVLRLLLHCGVEEYDKMAPKWKGRAGYIEKNSNEVSATINSLGTGKEPLRDYDSQDELSEIARVK